MAEEVAEAAVRGEDAPSLRLRFRAFELRPEMPLEGADARTFYARLFGGEERYAQIIGRMVEVGQEVGIRFDHPSIGRTANTRLAHRLIAIADDVGRGAATMSRRRASGSWRVRRPSAWRQTSCWRDSWASRASRCSSWASRAAASRWV